MQAIISSCYLTWIVSVPQKSKGQSSARWRTPKSKTFCLSHTGTCECAFCVRWKKAFVHKIFVGRGLFVLWKWKMFLRVLFELCGVLNCGNGNLFFFCSNYAGFWDRTYCHCDQLFVNIPRAASTSAKTAHSAISARSHLAWPLLTAAFMVSG